MRAVIQRVSQGNVSIEGKVKSSIGHGLLVLVGIETEDSREDAAWLSSKISRLRVFPDPGGMMNLSLMDTKGDVLVISQFTLHASTRKGNRPSFTRAARPERAIPLYEAFVKELEESIPGKVLTGKFGAMMEVSLINDGPVTIIIDTKNKA